MRVVFAGLEDRDYLVQKDHLSREVIEDKICRREFVVAYQDNQRVGFLRYNYFWDDVPFMNLL